MVTKNKIIQKFIPCLLIISILTPAIFSSFGVKKAEAQETAPIGVPVNDFPAQIYLKIITTNTTTSSIIDNKSWMQKLLEQLLKLAAKRLLAQMTQATINWINSGFHGSPLFLENPESFFRDIAKSQVKNLVDMIGYDTFRFPFGKEVALQVIDSYKSQLEINAQYTLSKVINDPDLLVQYRNDFNIGGWNGFLINTQYPQNNYLGFNMLIQQNLASRLEGTIMTPAQMVKDKLQQGLGFLSPQTCPSNPKYNNGANEFLRPSYKPLPFDTEKYPGASGSLQWERENNAARAEWTKNNTCPGGLVSTTPGSVAANQVFNALNVPFLTTALDGALGNSLAAIFDALINKLLDTGLSALASTVSPAPPADNWSYNGQTLSSGTSTYGAPAPLSIPQNVSARIDETTRTIISGGTQPYSILIPPDNRVAKAEISVSGLSGPTLSITGVAPGSTQVKVRDSSTSCPEQNLSTQCTAIVNIEINAIGVLAVTPASVVTIADNPITTTISGGEKPYSILTNPDQSVAVTGLAGENLIVTGVAPGSTFIEIKDSSTPAKTVRVNAIISTTERGALNIPQNISVITGTIVNSLPITGGTAPYKIVTTFNPEIATAQILGPNFDTLTITGKKQGETQVMVKDSSLATKFDNTSIIVTDPLVVSLSNYTTRICGLYSTYNYCFRDLTITGGMGNYSIQTEPDSRIATAQIINRKTLRITNYRTAGITSVLVKDASIAHPQTFLVNITVN